MPKPKNNTADYPIDQMLKKFSLFDDLFFTSFCQNEPPKVEYILRILMGIKLTVLESKTKYDIANLKGRSLQLDVYAKDKAGKYYNIEVQRATSGAVPQRARYHMSLIDAEKFPKNKKWSSLPETWVIFITEKDYYKKALPYYKIERVVQQTGDLFEDGGHILYINGKHRGNDPIGKLMHDFSCKSYKNMQDEYIKEGVRELIETDKGRNKIMETSEMLINIGRQQEREDMAAKMILYNKPLREIMEFCKMTAASIKKLANKLGAPMPA